MFLVARMVTSPKSLIQLHPSWILVLAKGLWKASQPQILYGDSCCCWKRTRARGLSASHWCGSAACPDPFPTSFHHFLLRMASCSLWLGLGCSRVLNTLRAVPAASLTVLHWAGDAVQPPAFIPPPPPRTLPPPCSLSSRKPGVSDTSCRFLCKSFRTLGYLISGLFQRILTYEAFNI